ncbi:MAG: hypothetical protein ACKVTZ_00155 [Bacteroidia bacterium]
MKKIRRFFTIALILLATAIMATACTGSKHGHCQANKVGNHHSH